jgi:hypothetical protein
MSLVDDNQTEVVLGPAVAPHLALQGLHAGDHDGCVERGLALAHFHLGLETGEFGDLVHRLTDEFFAVCQDEGAPGLELRCGFGEENRFSLSCWHDDQLAAEFTET